MNKETLDSYRVIPNCKCSSCSRDMVSRVVVNKEWNPMIGVVAHVNYKCPSIWHFFHRENYEFMWYQGEDTGGSWSFGQWNFSWSLFQ